MNIHTDLVAGVVNIFSSLKGTPFHSSKIKTWTFWNQTGANFGHNSSVDRNEENINLQKILKLASFQHNIASEKPKINSEMLRVSSTDNKFLFHLHRPVCIIHFSCVSSSEY